MTSALYLAILLLAAPGAYLAGWRARGRRDGKLDVPRSLVRGGRR